MLNYSVWVTRCDEFSLVLFFLAYLLVPHSVLIFIWFLFLYAVSSIAPQHFSFSWSDSEEVLVISVTVCESASGNSPPLMLRRSYLKAWGTGHWMDIASEKWCSSVFTEQSASTGLNRGRCSAGAGGTKGAAHHLYSPGDQELSHLQHI